MYERYWGLNGSPFQGTNDLRWFIETTAHEEALARLNFQVDQRRHFGLLRGPAGTGKTMVLQAARHEALQHGREVAAVDLLGLDSHEMLWQLGVALRLSPHSSCSRWWLWQAVSDHLQALHSAHIPTVLLCDHLERAESDCLSVLERLLHGSPSQTGCLTILAAARDAVDGSLFPELIAHSDLRIELPCLDRLETAQFVRGLLHQAACPREVFKPEALRTLFDLTEGEPRAITRLCHVALAAGAHQELLCLDDRAIRAAAGEVPTVRRHHLPRFEMASALR
jgi:type II secretory pathway predicted ATPase ExeA